MRFKRSRRRRDSSGSGGGGRRAGTTLAASLEALERRSLLAADMLDVARVLWQGKQVDAVRDEYVLRMPQTNVATATSALDYACKAPAAQAGWSMQSLGSGFFKLTAPGATQATLTTWASRQGVQSIDVNRISRASKAPNDPLYSDAANWGFPKISAETAWEVGTGTDTTIVAVLDSGVDYNHPDLAANMWKNPNEIAGDGIDNDRNGVIDDVFGFNALTASGNPMDDFGHGTFIAGIVGAVGNNATGMTGVNWSVKIMAVKVMDAAGNVSVANEIRGINYVLRQKTAGQNVVAVNCSFGRNAFNQQESDALAQLAATGITIVAAAGNDASDNDQFPVYPANYDIPGLISVAASDQNDNLAGFSNFGLTTVDLAAPGVGIMSTRATQATGIYQPYRGPNYTLSNDAGTLNQAFVDGTSASAAFVSGAAALLRSLKPVASVVQVRDAILNGVDRSVGLNGLVVSGGRLNLSNSVNLILATTGAFPVPSFVPGQNLSFIEGNQGYTLAEISVQLDRPCDPGKSASVFYTTQPGGSAFATVDYVATSGVLTFSGTETRKSFFIKIIGDRLAEQPEQFAVQLLRAKSGGIDPNTPFLQQVNPIILDDDYDTTPIQPGPTNPALLPKVSIDVKRQPADPANPGGPLTQMPFKEGGAATFVVSLDRTSTKTVSVKYRTNQPALPPAGTALENVDYKAASGTLTFRPGERSKEISVPILADKVVDPNETFRVVLSEPVNAEFNSVAVAGTGSAVDAVITDVASLPPAQPGFQITVTFPDSSLTTSQQAVFQQAATRWSEIITGDLPNVTDPTTGQVIDDILIVATAPTIDGPGGILGAAGPTDFRTGAKGLPWKGEMFFDSADVAAMQADGTFKNVILHEMAHVLGFGTLWTQFGLLQGAGTNNPIYVGANALREYKSIFGVTNATGVPVENTGGQGTADGHWRETVFVTELMTGYAEAAGTSMPISRMTVGQFRDLGYTVNYAKADAYTKPVPLVAPPAARVNSPAFLRGRPISIAPPPRTPVRVVTAQGAATSSPPASPKPAAPAKVSKPAAKGVGPSGFATLARA